MYPMVFFTNVQNLNSNTLYLEIHKKDKSVCLSAYFQIFVFIRLLFFMQLTIPIISHCDFVIDKTQNCFHFLKPVNINFRIF
jgi:hypothetical protein